MKIAEVIKTDKPTDNEQGVAINIMHTAYIVKTSINAVLKQYALTNEQYNMLRILKGAQPAKMCVKQIAERLIERSANVPRTMDKLVAKKLVRRSVSVTDKRETVSEISIAGLKMLETVTPELQQTLKDICKLNKQEQAELNSLLDKYRID
ncbi:MarR family winged helix-turn-helix transcriptional regulator [Arachidicoccus sp.]|uniref:MarR family winged helix-turn-helix transcriptional regulator n=1 Tax=Arachidicoccus sp. TaxID=1872624 RepID=UPI003D1D76A1